MLNFCTLFDTNYMAKGLCMYDSLTKHCSDFHLYIFAFDDNCHETLTQLKLNNVTIISLSEFEDEQLLKVKPQRSKAEYCWTCTSSTILYCIENYLLDHCTYIDADLYFYGDPVHLVNEMSANSDVLITEHRYTPIYDQSELSGKYCVQFVTFRDTENGMYILRWWRNACLDWCYARKEDGKFGDQKYLDDWTTRFKGVHELNHLGGGVAPWNVQQYFIKNKNNTFVIYHPDSDKYFDLIFFHFHYMHIYRTKFIYEFFFGHYTLPRKVLHYLYNPYVAHLKIKSHELHKMQSRTDGLGVKNQPIGWFRLIGHLIKNTTNPNRINWLRLWQN